MSSPDVSLFDLAAAIESQGTPKARIHRGSNNDQQEADSLLLKAYQEACKRHHAPTPFPDHVSTLKHLPPGLFARWHWNNMPPHGRAIVDISPTAGRHPTNEQLTAVLDTLLHLNDERAVLLHHLDLSCLHLTDTHIHLIRAAPSTTCHYNSITSLHLNHCGLSFNAFNNLLLHSDSVPLLESLERLDISHNPTIGLYDNDDDRIGLARNSSEFWRISRLWRCSKLRYIDLSWTNLSCEALCYILDYLIKYQALSQDNPTLPGGARCYLECIKMGPPSSSPGSGGGVINDAVVGKLREVMMVVPTLQVMEVLGVDDEQQKMLRREWNKVMNNNTLASDDDNNNEEEEEAGPLHTHIRLARDTFGELCAAEVPPTDHILPPPETPSYNNNNNRQDVEVDKHQHVLPPPPFSADLMAGPGPTAGCVSRRDQPQQQQFAVAQELRQVRPTQYQQQTLMPPRPSNHNRNNNSTRRRDEEDAFVGGGGEVDLEHSSQQHEQEDDDDEEDEVVDHRGNRVAAVMDDDEFDDDDKAGRAFKMRAKELCDKIRMVNIGDGKLADNCYKVWNRFALNAWDRRRWINPSRDQNDLPETVNKLCLMLDLFREYGYAFFPGNFRPPPSYRAGVVLGEYRKNNQEEVEEEREREAVPPVLKRIRPNEQPGVVISKRKTAVIDDDDDDDE
jgi:hypothetical protein